MTTHSTNFLDTADLRNIYLVSKEDSTSVQLLEIGEVEARILRELGIRLSSLFMYDRLVFVEGSSDEDILREWALKMEVNFSQANVGFIKMRGAGNLRHFAAEETLSFLTKRQVYTWFVMDRDEREDRDIQKIQARLGDKAVAKFLSKREIENYLVVPRPVRELIQRKAQSSRNDNFASLTDADVEETIEKCAESLKQLAIDKRVAAAICRPVYPSRDRLFQDSDNGTIADRAVTELETIMNELDAMRSQAQGVLEEQAAIVESSWANDKLATVPGDELLDAVFKEYGLRFRKEQDGARIAALMRESEISEEIKAILLEIGSN